MQRSSKGFAHILLVLVVVVLAIGGVGYVLVQNVLQNRITPEDQKMMNAGVIVYEYPKSTPTPTSDPLADWKTYSNTKFNYSFRYPDHWEPNRGPSNASDTFLAGSRDIDFYDPSLPSGEDPGTGFVVLVNELKINGSERSCGNLDDCFTKTFSWLTEEKQINKTKTSFQGVNAYTFNYTRETESYDQSWKYLYFIADNGNAYNIHISTDSSREQEIFDIFDQILSTFEFIDQQALNNGKRLYKNDKYGFSFEYTSDGLVEPESDNLQYLYTRIQNYEPDDFSSNLKSGEYYLEIFIYDKSQGHEPYFSSCEETLEDYEVVDGKIYKGSSTAVGGDQGGTVKAICVLQDSVGIQIRGTENHKDTPTVNSIFSTFQLLEK